MANSVTIERLEKDMHLFQKMYDAVRLVDPVKKTVLEYRGAERRETNEICYQYWGNGKICDNCISARAHLDNKCFMKLEQSPTAIMMVTALSVENAAEPMVLELLKDVTETMMVGSGDYSTGHLMHNVWTELNNMAIRDELTGLYNRRYVHERLPADIVKATLEGVPLSLLFADVNNLKQINDHFGHAKGDLVLRQIASAMQGSIRGNTDWVARYGGDEFVICLYHSGKEAAKRVMERVHNGVDNIVVLSDGQKITTSLSMGMHTLKDQALTPEELIELADQNMYAAKKRGHQEA